MFLIYQIKIAQNLKYGQYTKTEIRVWKCKAVSAGFSSIFMFGTCDKWGPETCYKVPKLWYMSLYMSRAIHIQSIEMVLNFKMKFKRATKMYIWRVIEPKPMKLTKFEQGGPFLSVGALKFFNETFRVSSLDQKTLS